jgi:AraC-like DNA-binding protein
MIFETHVPAAPLRPFVEFLWFYDGFAPQHTREKLLPDASMELIIDLREHPKRLWDSRDPNRATEFRRSWLSGMHTEYIIIDASPGSMMGVHFKAGGARPFVDMPLSEFTDTVVPFESVVGQQRAGSLRDRLLEADPFPRKFAVLETFLLAAAGNRLVPDALVSGTVPALRGSETTSIRELAARAGVSQRHLIEKFEDQVGLRPKQLQRICRFQHVIQRLSHKRMGEADWVAIALECGYYDQSHFIHDFAGFTGHTPTDFLRQQREHDNYVIMDPLFPEAAGSAAAD